MDDTGQDRVTQAAAVARHQALPVGVVVERRQASNPWDSVVWQPVSVVAGAPSTQAWSVMREAADTTTYFAGNHAIELVPTEAPSYRQNLMTERPAVYVILRPDAQAPLGVAIAHVTVSPTDAEAYMVSGDDVVEPVPMPMEIADWLQDYVAAHYVEERFHKRQRKRHDAGGSPRAGDRRDRDSG